jgi:cytochrome d ubiquinol oxidase subunit II
VLCGAALFAAFPQVYSIVLSALHLPIVLMLVCLIFRGVSFEIRGKAKATKHLWSLAFMYGSAGATFMQGVILASYLQGIPVTNREFSGDAFQYGLHYRTRRSQDAGSSLDSCIDCYRYRFLSKSPQC